MTTSLGEHLDRQKFSLWISAAEFPPDHILRGRQVESREILAVDFRRRISARPEILEALLPWLHPLFHIACFCGSASDTLARGMYRSGIGISSCTGRLLPKGARGVHLPRRAAPSAWCSGKNLLIISIMPIITIILIILIIPNCRAEKHRQQNTTLSFHHQPGIC